jgi:TonB family protein
LSISRSSLVLTAVALYATTAFAASTHRNIVSRTPPVYPDLARRMHVSGKVLLLVTVDASGSVSATKVESGHALLTSAAQDAVRRWRFSPGSDASESEIEVNFTLDGQ